VTLLLHLAETWGVPPWVLERELSLFWAEAACEYEREQVRRMKREIRRYGGR